jgi:hypothetical protein
MFALIENGVVTRYPYTVTDVRLAYPDVSFAVDPSDEALAAFGMMRVFFTTPPTANEDTQKVVEEFPVFNATAQRWEQNWQVVALTADELQAKDKALYDSIVADTQVRLDTFAQSRGYDSILSACTYATSPTVKFATEGQYCVGARDATWAKLIEILGEITAGTRPRPSGYADIEADLPPLVWP